MIDACAQWRRLRAGLALLGLALASACAPGCQDAPPGVAPVDLTVGFAGAASVQVEAGDPVPIYALGRGPTLLITPAAPEPGRCDPLAGGEVAVSLTAPDGDERLAATGGVDATFTERVPGGWLIHLEEAPEGGVLEIPGRWALRITARCPGPAGPAVTREGALVARARTADNPEVLAAVEDALALAEGGDPVDPAALPPLVAGLADPLGPTIALGRLGRALHLEGRDADAEAVALTAAALAREGGVVSEEARMFNLAHEAARDAGALERAVAHADAALALDHRWGLVARLPSDLYARAFVLDQLGRRLEALEAAADARLAALTVGDVAMRLATETLELALLQVLGHHEVVAQRLAELDAEDDDPAIVNNVGWLLLLAAESSLPPGPQRDEALRRAADAFTRSLALYGAEGTPLDLTNGRVNLARVRALQGDGDAARALQEAAREGAPDADLERLMAVTDAHLALAAGRPADALAVARRLEAEASLSGALDHAGQGASLQGEALLTLGDPRGAIAAYDQALRWSEQIPDLRSPLHRSTLMASRAPWEARAITVRLDQGLAAEALAVAEHGALERRRASAPGGGAAPEDPAARAQLDELEALRRSVSRLPQTPRNAQRLAAIEEELQRRWAARIALALPGEAPPPLTAAALAGFIPEDGALLRPASLPGELILWTAEGGALSVRRAPFGREALAQAVDAFAASCAAGSPDPQGGEALAQALLGPLAEDPPPRLAVVTEGALRRLPWGCLPTARGPLLHSTAVYHLPSLLEEPPAASGREVLILADPGRDLPVAFAEGKWLATERFPGARLLSREEVTLDALRPLLVGARLVHFAGHGESDPHRPWLSHLRLARGDRLTLMDVADLHLSGPLIFLNACEAGQLSGEAGALGLADGLVAAGARGVVASRWAVPDEAGARVSRAFYRRLEVPGADGPTALSEALREVARGGIPPAVWGAYLYLGSP